jgi:large subunit ribosomal protein L10Ae
MASKLSNETVTQAVNEIKKAASAKKRKFTETIELQVALKNYDPNKDKRFGGAIKLPTIPRPKYKVCLIGDDKHCHEAKEAKVPFLTQDDLKKNSSKNKRKFVETIELQIALKNYDPNKDKRFGGAIKLPLIPRPKFSVCIIGDDKHCHECKEKKIPFLTADDLKKMNKNKKAVKKLAKQYDSFLASASLIRKIPRLLGPGLNKAGKFPSVLGANEDIPSKVEDTKATVKFALKSKKALCMGIAIANVSQPDDAIVANITLAVNFLVSLLPKSWQQVKRLYIKSTMGPSFRIFGF